MKERLLFRAWDPLGKKMLFSKVFQKPGESINSFLAFEYPYDGPERKYMGWNEMELIIMQCTGMKDKKGKNVFEGDILKLDDINDPRVVTWHNVACLWDTCERARGSDFSIVSANRLLKHKPVEPKHWQDEAEIIGNIYENNNLLLTQKELEK